jgi:hypothetical protein
MRKPDLTWVYVLITVIAALLWARELMAQGTCTTTCVWKDRNGQCMEWQTYCPPPPRQPVCRQECSWLDPQTGCKEYRTVCR